MRRNLGKLAAILGILQGIAWAAMALAAIILHHWSPNFESSTTYTQYIGYLLYDHFLSGDSTNGITFIIRPSDFTIFMWVYFLLSVGWSALSGDQLAAIYFDKKRQTTIMVMWGAVTFTVSLLDLIFVCLLARDYAACVGESTILDPAITNCYLTVGIAMTIAARGFTLWFINLALSVIMLYGAVQIVKEKHSRGSLSTNHSIPRIQIPRANPNRSLPADTKRSYDFSTSSFEQSFSRGGPLPPDFLSGDASPPSFLTRGDKFSY